MKNQKNESIITTGLAAGMKISGNNGIPVGGPILPIIGPVTCAIIGAIIRNFIRT